jgi:hypothetical protein
MANEIYQGLGFCQFSQGFTEDADCLDIGKRAADRLDIRKPTVRAADNMVDRSLDDVDGLVVLLGH